MNIGILGIQGSVEEHKNSVLACGVNPIIVKSIKDLKSIKALILPGGESTTIGKLLKIYGLDKEIIRYAKQGMPIYGTCAGSILMAKHISGKDKADNLELMDIETSRNAYGSQLESFETQIEIPQLSIKNFPAVFIRAPKIKNCGKNVEILAKYRGEKVLVKEGHLLASSFHPELTTDLRIHQFFIKLASKI